MYAFGQIRMSMKLSGVVGFLGVVMVNAFEAVHKWMDVNFDYVAIALILVAVDHLLGSLVHQFYLKDFDWRKNIIGLLIKLSMVVCAGLVFEGLTHITKEQYLVYTYLKMTTRLIVCIYPGMSAMKNMRIITRGAFPPAVLVGKFEKFNNGLDIEELKKGNNKKEEE